ncbi:MAG: FG-GAP-like repeat-containing protein [Solirubrobacteraceae bacterium]
MSRVLRRPVQTPSPFLRSLRSAALVVTVTGAAVILGAPSASAAVNPLKLTSVVTTPGLPGNANGFGLTRALLGDFDGDGIGDAAFVSNANAYVVRGTRSAPVDLDLTQPQGARVTTYTTTQAGGFVQTARAGDVDHDGKADLVLATASLDYVVYGSSAVAGRTIDLDGAGAGASKFKLRGGTTDIRGIGDFDGDGIDDLAVARGDLGSAIVRGGPRLSTLDPNTQNARVSLINSTQTCAWIWFQYHCVYVPVRLSALGDFNGDGRTDVGVTSNKPDSSYVLYGRSGTFSVSATLGAGALKLPTTPGDQLSQIDGIGDVDGDGLDDLVLSGAKIIFGRRGTPASLPSGDPQVTLADGSTNTTAVVAAGDQNGDGRDDIVAYRYTDDVVPNGPLHLITSVPRPPATLDVAGSPSVPLPPGRSSGYLFGGGDLDGDGVDDLLVSQYGATGTWVLTHGTATSPSGGGGPAATASLDVKLTVVGPYGRPLKQLTYDATATCNVANDPIHGANGETKAFTRAAFQAGDPCDISAYRDFSPITPNQFVYTDCTFVTSVTFNGVAQPTPPYYGPGASVKLAAGANHFVQTDTCVLPNTPDLPTKIVDSGWTATGAAYGNGGGGDQVLATAAAGKVGSIVWRAPLDLNGKTISFTLTNSGGNGAGEGTTVAFLPDDLSSDGTDPLGGYLGGGAGLLGFGGLQGLALAFDEVKEPGDPSANFVGWADGVSGTSLRYLQTADPGVTLRGSKIAVRIVSKNGVVSVYVNGSLRMSRTMTLPAPAHLAFTASTGASVYEAHTIPASGLSITTS